MKKDIKLFATILAVALGLNVSAQEQDLLAIDGENHVSVVMKEGAFLGNYLVKGKVICSATGTSFAGVRINVVDARISAMTEEDGTFEIRVPDTDVTLEVEAPGYQKQLVPLKGRTYLEIKILEKNQTSYYDKDILSSLNKTEITTFSPDFVTIDEDISARLSGHLRSIIHSGEPGGGAAVFLQGLNSVNISAQPLYVVDGVAWQIQEGDEFGSIHSGFFSNPLSLINPNDIEKITVLKSGTALYGSKGANGVILIDTKRARTMATSITAYASVGYRSPFESMPLMDASAFRLYASDVLSNKYTNSSIVDSYKFLSDDESRPYYRDTHNNTDWLGEINKGAITQNYGLSVQGGDEVALYSFSMGYTNSEGNVEETNFNRLNARFNSDIKMTERFKATFDLAFTQVNNQVRNGGLDSISAPVFLAMIKSPLYSPYQFNDNGSLSNRLTDVDELEVGNPMALIRNGLGRSEQYGLNANLRPSYTFGKDKVILSLLLSYNWRKLGENSFTPDMGIAESPLYNEMGEVYAESRNLVKDRMDKQISMMADGRVDWNILLNTTHNLAAFGGYRFYSDSYNSSYAQGHNTGSDNMNQLTNTTAGLRHSTGIDNNWKSISWYSNVHYGFKNRYFLNYAMALDASSRFGKDADAAMNVGNVAWGFFPSVSAGWLVSSERFMQSVNFINNLRLRVGYDITGNDHIPNYASRSYFTSIKYTGKAMGIVLDNIGNEQLKWEDTYKATVGLDASILNNRWAFGVEYYTSKTKDLLTRKSLNEVAGLNYYWSNEGELENKGYEVSTNIRVLDYPKFKLDLGAVVGHYKNKITSLPNGTFDTDICGAQIRTQEGLPVGVFYGYKTQGVYATQEEARAANLAIETISGQRIPFEAGDMRFEEVVKDGVIDEKDRQIIGDPNPDFYGNFTLNLKYKRLSLGTLFTYSYGNDVYNALRASLESGKLPHNQTTAMQNRWVAEGQQTNTPRATFGDPMGNARFSDRWIEDGSYLRFKSITLSYDIPFNMTFVQAMSVWASVNNIYTFTKYLGADPEFAYGNQTLYQGVDAGLVPQSRSFNFGVRINL